MSERRGTIATERREGWKYAIATRRFVFILFVLVVLYVTVLWAKNESDSCHRSMGNRTPIRNAISMFPGAREKLGPAPPVLDCSLPFPDH